MAILKSGLFGMISGKIGDNVYFVTKNGRQGIRKVSKRTSKEPTQAQLEQRARFATATSFLRALRPLFQALPCYAWKNHSYYGISLRRILSEAIIGTYPDYQIDYSKVAFIHTAHKSYQGRALCDSCGIIFQLPNFGFYCSYSQVIMIAFNPNIGQAVVNTADFTDTTNTCTLQLPGNFLDDQVISWLIFTGWDGKPGDTFYYGSVSSYRGES